MAARKPSRSAGRSGRSARSRKPAARTRKPAARTRATSVAAATQPAAHPDDRRRKDPETLRLRGFEPTYTVDDIERSERFYTQVLGFIVDQRWTKDGQLQGLLLKAGNSRIGLSQDDWARGRDRKKGVGYSVWCETAQDIDAIAARIKGAGGTLAAGPSDEPGLGRYLTVDDPDGFRLRIYRRG